MPKLLALDFGLKRTGIAITDDHQIIASGLTTVASGEVIAFLKTYFKTNQVEKIIIGEPKQMNGQPSESTELIENYVAQIKHHFPEVALARMDERFTSKMAFQVMIDSGLKKNQRKNKALVDEIAATILLQDYLKIQKK